MDNFTLKELRMIQTAIETEIIRREENPFANPERLAKYNNLYDKVYNIIQSMK